MTVWMQVTQDKYQLPVFIADSRPELAKMAGVDPNVISSSMWHARRGRIKEKYIKVVIDDKS